MTDKIQKIYSCIFARTQGYADFELSLTIRNEKFINSFLKIIDKEIGLESIGNNFLFDFAVYQFCYYENLKSARRPQLNWIFGKAAFERWQKRNKSVFLYWNRVFCQKYDIISPLTSEVATDSTYTQRERKRFYNTEKGLVHCLTNELNDDIKNTWCRFCKHKKNCYEH